MFNVFEILLKWTSSPQNRVSLPFHIYYMECKIKIRHHYYLPWMTSTLGIRKLNRGLNVCWMMKTMTEVEKWIIWTLLDAYMDQFFSLGSTWEQTKALNENENARKWRSILNNFAEINMVIAMKIKWKFAQKYSVILSMSSYCNVWKIYIIFYAFPIYIYKMRLLRPINLKG